VRCFRDPSRIGRVVHPVAGALLIVLTSACAVAPAPAARPVPAPEPTLLPDASAGLTTDDEARLALAGRRLIVPVAGVEPSRIADWFSARRGSRAHGALDIMAPRGTPVLSADDGRVLRVSENRAGGLTIYATDPGGRLVYYYAHLDRYADGLSAGRMLARGDTIGFVGTTGNAPPNTPHLHFQMMLMRESRRYWEGVPVNPLPFLTTDSTSVDEPYQ
jgi:murein DD-endopeptidase MepM/ murein hydrolase activator NlpD